MTVVTSASAAVQGDARRARSFAPRLLFLMALAVATPAIAQAPPSASNGWDNAYYQILAESLRRAGQGKWVYSSDGHAIGRIADIRTAADGMHEVAVVGVRRRMGGGEIALSINRLGRRKGRIFATDDRAAIRAMERIGRPPGSRS